MLVIFEILLLGSAKCILLFRVLNNIGLES